MVEPDMWLSNLGKKRERGRGPSHSPASAQNPSDLPIESASEGFYHSGNIQTLWEHSISIVWHMQSSFTRRETNKQ